MRSQEILGDTVFPFALTLSRLYPIQPQQMIVLAAGKKKKSFSPGKIWLLLTPFFFFVTLPLYRQLRLERCLGCEIRENDHLVAILTRPLSIPPFSFPPIMEWKYTFGDFGSHVLLGGQHFHPDQLNLLLFANWCWLAKNGQNLTFLSISMN